MAIGAPQSISMKVGGKTSSGPKDGIYRCIVAEASVGLSKGDEQAGKPQRPYIQLDLHGKGDNEHPTLNGKKVITARFYGSCAEDDRDKAEQMQGMLKSRLYRGFNIPWPKDGKDVDPRIFLKKEVFVYIGKGNPDESGEARAEVKAIALKKEQLPKSAFAAASKKEDAED